ncbi:ead/Ea22-like family protein [Enterobacter sp. UPMP2076]
MSNIDKNGLLGVPKHANQHRLSRLTMEVHTDELRIMASEVESYTDELIAALEDAGKRIADSKTAQQTALIYTAEVENQLEDALARIAELEAREVNLPKLSVGEVMHMSGFSRDYAEGWCSGNDNAIHEIYLAGVNVAAAGKGE